MKKNSSTLRNAFDLVLIALVSVAFSDAAHAADKIRYEDIPQHVASFGTVLYHRGFTVITIDGKKYESRTLRLEADHVELFHGAGPGEKVPSEYVARIEIRQSGRYFHHIVESAWIPLLFATAFCEGPDYNWVCTAALTPLFSPAWAYTAVTAPFFLAADAIAFFLPPRVFEIVH
jgi:hypothetical protein